MTSWSALLFLLFGLMAGVLTTVSGQGGGLILLLAVSTLVGPREALAITAPALLFGNLHRAVLLRDHIDRRVAVRMMIGTLPGALLGGFATGVIPAWGLRLALLVMTALAIAKALGWLDFQVKERGLGLAGFGIGVMTGTSGGAGLLLAPLLLSAGLSGPAFVATTSALAVSMHIGRVIGYAGLGFFSGGLVGTTVLVTVAIFAGNWLGGRIQAWLSRISANTGRARAALEYGALIVCVALSVAGFG
jgi:uncharacterized membrane protein YfcA